MMKEKNIDKEEVKMTLLVLYYLNTNSSINKVEYMLIIKKVMLKIILLRGNSLRQKKAILNHNLLWQVVTCLVMEHPLTMMKP